MPKDWLPIAKFLVRVKENVSDTPKVIGKTLKDSCRACTTADTTEIEFDSYNAGIITTSSPITTVDGVEDITVDDRILINNLTDRKYNGIY
jgi:hypothetical protein